MRRSQPEQATPVKKPARGTATAKLEQAYGVSASTKPLRSTLKTEKPVLTKTPVKPTKTQLSSITSKNQSTRVGNTKVLQSDKYGSLGIRESTLKPKKMVSTPNQSQPAAKLKNSVILPSPQIKKTMDNQTGSTGIRKAQLKLQDEDEVDYEDDFEDDYQSDFEEVASTDEEDLGHDDGLLEVKAALEREINIKTHDTSMNSPTPSRKLELSVINVANNIPQIEEIENHLDDDDEESDYSEELSGRSENDKALQSKSYPGFFRNMNESDQGTGDGTHSSALRKQIESGRNPHRDGQIQIGSSELQMDRGISAVSLSTQFKKGPVEVLNKSKSTFDFGRGKREADREAKFLRGKKLQGMIRLDRVCSELLHLEPSYEQFMLSFTGTRRVQESVQTDNETFEESAQTDNIDKSNKWTQKPPTWSNTSYRCDVRIVRQEALGVGGEEYDGHNPEFGSLGDDSDDGFDFLRNWEKLSKFISRSSRKILYILESEKRLKLPKSKSSSGGSEIKMNRGLAILNNLDMSCLNCEGDFVACSNGHLTDTTKKNASKHIITVWSLKEPSIPIYFLRAWGQVSVIKVYPLGHVVVSGNGDGSISLWDMDEPAHYHTQYQEQVIRTPSVTTSCMESSHYDTIVGLGVLPESKDTSLIISLDKGGTLNTWVCMRTKEPIEDGIGSQHKSAWSKIHLTIRNVTSLNNYLNESLCITSFNIWTDQDSTEFLMSTMNGYTARGLLTGEKVVFQKYCESDSTEKDSGVLCFDLSSDFNILAIGCHDKKCRLYEFSERKMILEITLEGCPSSIKWSRRRSSILYVALFDTILIWDLLVSDMAPWKTISAASAVNGLAIYTTPQKEFTVSMGANELKISSLVGDVSPLSSRDQDRMQSFITLLVN